MKKSIFAGLTLFMAIHFAPADLLVGTFQNMDFETRISSEYNYWNPDPAILNNFSWEFGSQYILNDMWLLSDIEQYVFHTGFNGSVSLSMCTSPTATIRQNGTIPVTANSVQFSYGGLLPVLYLDGNKIDLIEDSPGILKGDIRPWSGQTVELSIKAENYEFYDGVNVDNIGFSTAVVPEPTIARLMFFPALYFILRYRRTKKEAGSPIQ